MPFFKKNGDVHKPNFTAAIIDIGSNSVRLVVYAGSRRNPAIVFNEKVLAGLGADLIATGRIGDAAMERGLRALARFKMLIEEMAVDEVTCVATAAVRDATNGSKFADQVKQLGFKLHVITGEEEAEAAALGVISAIPGARGIVGDLGGGSLELARIADGKVLNRLSLPLGVLRAAPLRDKGELDSSLRNQLRGHGWLTDSPCENFYMVGGSWRALARLDMNLTGYPLRVLHDYELKPDRVQVLADVISGTTVDELKKMPKIPPSRAANLLDAVTLLKGLDTLLKPDTYRISAYGLREGLLFRNMNDKVRARDPFLDAAAQFGQQMSRFGWDGDSIHDWIKPLFAEDPPRWQRLLRSACHLADVGWNANPDFRAERGVEIALHGNWVGVDGEGRNMVAQALYTGFGGGTKPYPDDVHLVDEAAIRRAITWGLALRLGLRLGGGSFAVFTYSSLHLDDTQLALHLPAKFSHIYGENVESRHRRLAQFMGREATVTLV